MARTVLTIDLDDDLRRSAEPVLKDMGLNMNTAFTMFLETVIKNGNVSFEVYDDPFYSETNQKRLKEAVADLKAGRDVIIKTMEELEEMENE